MQERTAVTAVLQVVSRQHARARGLVWEAVLGTARDEQECALACLTHYLVLHLVAENLALRRGVGADPLSPPTAGSPRCSPLVEMVTDVTSRDARHGRDLHLLENAVVRHARLLEHRVLPRLLGGWDLGDLERAAEAMAEVDTHFDRDFSRPYRGPASAQAQWAHAIEELRRTTVPSYG